MNFVRNHTGDFGDPFYGSIYGLADAGNKANDFSYYLPNRLDDFESKFGDLCSSSLNEMPDFLSS